MTESSVYFMDDEREAGRLESKVDASHWVAQYLQKYLDTANAILDVGCGPGVIACQVARNAPHASVTGIDVSEQRIALAHERFADVDNAESKCADATDIPFPDKSFDLIYCRFLLEYLPDPALAVKEMSRVLRPGGRILLQDLDGQLLWHWPIEPKLQQGIEHVVQALAATGFDPHVGRKLYSHLVTRQLENIEVNVEPYHLYAGAIDEVSMRLWKLKLDIARPAAVRALGSEVAAVNLVSRFLEYLHRDDTLTYSTVFTVTGMKAK